MKKKTFAVLVLGACGLNTSFWLLLRASPNVAVENGLMENFEAAGLALGFLIWLVLSLTARLQSEKVVFSGLALLFLSFFVLEVDFRNLDAPVLNKLFNGRIRDGWLLALWLVGGVAFWRNRKPSWAYFLTWIKSPAGILLLLSAVFWIASGLIDKSLLGEKNLFHEELMEVNAALLMLLSAIISCRKPRAPSPGTTS